MDNEFHVYLIFEDFDFDPSQISQQVNITPSESWKIGDVKKLAKNGHMVIKKNSWKIKSTLPKNSSLEDHLNNIFSQLKKSDAEVKKLSSRINPRILCAVYSHETNPEMLISPKLVKKLAEYNASLHFDLYCLKD